MGTGRLRRAPRRSRLLITHSLASEFSLSKLILHSAELAAHRRYLTNAVDLQRALPVRYYYRRQPFWVRSAGRQPLRDLKLAHLLSERLFRRVIRHPK